VHSRRTARIVGEKGAEPLGVVEGEGRREEQHDSGEQPHEEVED
jgi:hypothetical protein